MDTDTLKSFLSILGGGAGSTATAFFVWAIWTGKLYLPREIKWRDDYIAELKARGDAWMNAAMRSTTNNERLIETNQKVVAVAQSLPPSATEARPSP